MMPLKARFCSQCTAPIGVKDLDGHPREVCTACGTVFYRNPLPVASAVVLNANREVLLVKRARDPFRGMWCLPIGFAELHETIAEAALRELREEAGVVGRILHLLDADSFASDFYGDLLIVAFEIEQVGGAVGPGDDADDANWFPLDSLPPLAFPSNEKALEACRERHRDEWAIQDSFQRLHGDAGEELLSDALVSVLRDQASAVADLWLSEIRASPSTRSYSTLQPELLRQQAMTALSQFGRWLKGREADQEVRDFYFALGSGRRLQGVALHEALSSLTLFRKNLWTFARFQGVWERPIDAYRVLELDRRIVAFFDRAAYHLVRGYTSET